VEPLVFLLITDAGGGHRAAAESLVEWARRTGKRWDVRIVNLYREMLHDEEPIKHALGFYGEDAYNVILKRQIRRSLPLLQRVAAMTAHLPNKRARKAATDFLTREKPDLSVSLMPFVNDYCAVIHADSGVPFGLVCTDIVDIRPRMWFTPRAMAGSMFVCVGSPEAARQAREAGAGDRLFETGLVVHPRFFDEETRELTSTEARRRLGLEQASFTATILMGGYGGPSVRNIVKQLEALDGTCQIVACCGHNDRLYRQMLALAATSRNHVVPLGFTTEVPEIMRASDVLISKPGTTTVMEALALGVPLVLDDVNAMPQERPVAAWAEAQRVALRLRRRSDVLDVIRRLRSDPGLGLEMCRRQQECAGQPAGPRVLDAMETCLPQALPPR
jgi:UDP-N-acetylglucosamine:LPS N-acetylglucosamine transferase